MSKRAEWAKRDDHELSPAYLKLGLGFDALRHISLVDLKSWHWAAYGPTRLERGQAESPEAAERAAESALDQMLADLAAARGYKLVKEDGS